MDYKRLSLYGTSVHIVKTKFTKFMISDHFNTVTGAAKEYGATIVINGDGWPNGGTKPNSIAYSNGKAIQAVQKDYRPWINVSRDGQITFAWKNPYGLYNAVSGDRYLVENGAINPRFYQDAKYQVKDARTAIGVDKDNNLILLVADGNDPKGIGLNFIELAQVMIDNGAATAINLDGGGSSAMWIGDKIVNTPRDDDILIERSVVNHVMVWTDVVAPPPPPPPPPDNDGFEPLIMLTIRGKSRYYGIK